MIHSSKTAKRKAFTKLVLGILLQILHTEKTTHIEQDRIDKMVGYRRDYRCSACNGLTTFVSQAVCIHHYVFSCWNILTPQFLCWKTALSLSLTLTCSFVYLLFRKIYYIILPFTTYGILEQNKERPIKLHIELGKRNRNVSGFFCWRIESIQSKQHCIFRAQFILSQFLYTTAFHSNGSNERDFFFQRHYF